MSNLQTRCLLIIMLVVCGGARADAQGDGKRRLLLVGDSTTIGNLPRQVNPEGPHLEQMIEQFAAIEGLPALEVINAGKGGETAKRLLGSKWYEEQIAHVEGVDYLFLRMGINDWFKCEDFQADFPAQMKALIAQLREDHGEATIVLCTICRFMPHDDCAEVNELIKQVAQSEELELLDVYTPYHQFLLDNGENVLNVRQPPLSSIPKKYHAWLKPYTHWQKGWNGKPDQFVVRVNDLSLDPIFGHLKGWYFDRHPNSTGYRLIANETVKYLAPVLRERLATATP